MKYLHIDTSHRVIVWGASEADTPVSPVLSAHPAESALALARIDGEHFAVRIPNLAPPGEDVALPPAALAALPDVAAQSPRGARPLRAVSPRLFAHRLASRGLMLLNNRDRLHFDPHDGSPVSFDADGIVAHGQSGKQIFPRLDPCIMARIEFAASRVADERILLAENVRRPGYFTCFAGYIEPGETPEDAVRREVREEAGRRISTPTYEYSQPWALSNALMLGFSATTTSWEAEFPTDEEMVNHRWFSRGELADAPLPGKGSLSYRLIHDWLERPRAALSAARATPRLAGAESASPAGEESEDTAR